jgi:hypothetical protein
MLLQNMGMSGIVSTVAAASLASSRIRRDGRGNAQLEYGLWISARARTFVLTENQDKHHDQREPSWTM